MIDPISVFEHFTLVTPFGVRFWDGVTGRVIADGLNVTAYSPLNAVHQIQTIGNRKFLNVLAHRILAFPNRQGVYVLQHLPGLRAIENGVGDANFWANLPAPKRSFVIEVIDTSRRFQPFSFTTELPARGLFTLTCEPVGSPLDATMSMVPLYSAASRLVPGGMAVLRADLWDPEANVPAPWAVLEAHLPGQPPVRGLAGIDGHVVLVFPYPEPINSATQSLDSPPGSTTTALTEQKWPISLQASYTRLSPVPRLPDLCTTLTQQAANLWVDAALSQPLTGRRLKFGQELVVQSQDSTLPSVLLITPAASPP